MATAPFVIERKVQYHGIWNTGLQVTDQFIKNIAQQFDSKPACPTFITLSANSITLVVLTRQGDKELHRDHIAFDALREIAVNAYNSRCLMILYINNKSKFSIIVCSCQDSREAMNISLAYKQLKNYRLLNPDRNNVKQDNWTLRRSSKDLRRSVSSESSTVDKNGSGNGRGDGDSISTRSRTESGVMSESFAFLNNEDVSVNGEYEEVFEGMEEVERVPVEDEEEGEEDPKAFHVGIQVNLEDTQHQEGSVSSRSSLARSTLPSLQSLTDEVKVIENGQWEGDSPGIGQAEFFRTDLVEEPVADRDDKSEEDAETGEENESPKTRTVQKLTQTEDSEKAEYRSVSTQTVTGGILRRYKKRAGGSSTSSNVYKEMAAQRKSGHGQVNGSSNNGAPNGSNGPNGSSGSMNGFTNGSMNGSSSINGVAASYPPEMSGFTSSSNGNYLRARPASYHSGVPNKSLFMPRRVQTSSTSVSRPIEDVYRSLSRGRRGEGSGRSRRVIVYTQQPRR